MAAVVFAIIGWLSMSCAWFRFDYNCSTADVRPLAALLLDEQLLGRFTIAIARWFFCVIVCGSVDKNLKNKIHKYNFKHLQSNGVSLLFFKLTFIFKIKLLVFFYLRIVGKCWRMWQSLPTPSSSRTMRAFDWHIFIWPWPKLYLKVNGKGHSMAYFL